MANGDQYNLSKRGKFWVPDFTLHGVRVHKSTKCAVKADAIERCDLWAKEIRDKKDGVEPPPPPPPPPPTLRWALDEWVRVKAGAVVDDYLRNVHDALELHMGHLLALPLDQLTTAAVEEARAAYLASTGRGHRPGQNGEWELEHTQAGANKIVRYIGTITRWAVSRGIIPVQPFALKPLKPQPEIKSVLWPEQVADFLAEADGGRRYKGQAFPHSATAIRLMIILGLREDEALNARWEWIDRRRQVYVVGMSKDRDLREVPITDYLMDHLDRVLGPTTAWPRGLILPAEDGDPHRGQFTLHPVSRCGERMGIDGLTPHRLRATFATCHFEAGTRLSQIQQMMGHDDPDTTMRYIIQRPRDQAESQERVSRRMGLEAPTGPHAGPPKFTQVWRGIKVNVRLKRPYKQL